MDREEKRLKVNLELHVVGDGRTFLNFWNCMNGDDVVAEVKNGGLYKTQHVDGIEVESEIGIEEFLKQVKSKFD